MSPNVRELFEKASELPEQDRAELAGLLIGSLDPEIDDHAEEAWAAEIDRRLRDFDAGRIRTVPWAEVRAQLHRGK
jgi:putative addiction module component (TIGR02574 family)